jgi:hypothetical protein
MPADDSPGQISTGTERSSPEYCSRCRGRLNASRAGAALSSDPAGAHQVLTAYQERLRRTASKLRVRASRPARNQDDQRMMTINSAHCFRDHGALVVDRERASERPRLILRQVLKSANV